MFHLNKQNQTLCQYKKTINNQRFIFITIKEANDISFINQDVQPYFVRLKKY